jgi:hypothetical protein
MPFLSSESILVLLIAIRNLTAVSCPFPAVHDKDVFVFGDLIRHHAICPPCGIAQRLSGSRSLRPRKAVSISLNFFETPNHRCPY